MFKRIKNIIALSKIEPPKEKNEKTFVEKYKQKLTGNKMALIVDMTPPVDLFPERKIEL